MNHKNIIKMKELKYKIMYRKLDNKLNSIKHLAFKVYVIGIVGFIVVGVLNKIC